MNTNQSQQQTRQPTAGDKLLRICLNLVVLYISLNIGLAALLVFNNSISPDVALSPEASDIMLNFMESDVRMYTWERMTPEQQGGVMAYEMRKQLMANPSLIIDSGD